MEPATETEAAPTAAPEPGSLITGIPGRARPRSVALAEFEKAVADLKSRLDPVFWFLYIPEVKDVYRWRVQLACGCVREMFVSGKDRFPDQGSDTDPLTGYRLPSGEYWCAADQAVKKPYREIVSWGERKVREFPADPEDPQHGLDEETWETIRRTEPHSSAFWRVTLSCGHFADVCVTDLDWKPEHGPRLLTKTRLAEIRADFEEMWASGDGWPAEGPEREHRRRMLNLGWPRPEPERDCFACTGARRVIGYQRIGPLVAPPKPAPPPSTARQRVNAQLARAEAEVARLRKQLEHLPD